MVYRYLEKYVDIAEGMEKRDHHPILLIGMETGRATMEAT